MKDNKPLIVLLILLLVGGLVYGFMVYGTPLTSIGATVGASSSNSVETPYGEKLEISLGSSSETSGVVSFFEIKAPQTASWVSSYQNSDSQDVYEVNGTYKSQEQVTMEYSLSVSYSNVESISATVKVKAYEEGNKAINYNEYTLANNKALSGVSPIADSDSTVPSILQHLTDVGGSTTNEVVGYEIYCVVTATGTKSGDTLTATIPYTHFGGFSFVKSSESSTAQVTPTISAASFIETYDPWTLSYYDDVAGLPEGTVMMYMGVSIAALVSLFIVWSERMRL